MTNYENQQIEQSRKITLKKYWVLSFKHTSMMINNVEIGSALLRIIEVIGQDDLDALDEDTLYFIVSALNQLDIDYIRNKILLKVLHLNI